MNALVFMCLESGVSYSYSITICPLTHPPPPHAQEKRKKRRQLQRAPRARSPALRQKKTLPMLLWGRKGLKWRGCIAPTQLPTSLRIPHLPAPVLQQPTRPNANAACHSSDNENCCSPFSLSILMEPVIGWLSRMRAAPSPLTVSLSSLGTFRLLCTILCLDKFLIFIVQFVTSVVAP